jgi:prepilin-type N-terminal cleavage/methylation domain-containing protein
MQKKNKSGFTLVELLVVIAIIGILMAITVPGISKTKERAMKMKARQECNAIKTAIIGYYNEYGKYPLQTSTTDQETTLTAQLTDILRAQDDTENPRKIVFLAVSQNSLKDIDGDDTRQMLAPIKDGNALAEFKVVMDYNFDNEVSANGNDLEGTQVAVWVDGYGEGGDEINSWE